MKLTQFLIAGLILISGSMTVHAARYALLVGINEYRTDYIPEENFLYSCAGDAYGIYHCLAEDESLWPSANMTVLTDSTAKKATIRTRLGLLATYAFPGDTVLYFHSSHGGAHSGTDTYLCAFDENYEDEELASDLALFRDGVKVIVIIDACNSAGLFLNALTEESPAVAAEWDIAGSVMKHLNSLSKTATKAADIGWITAADYDEESWAGTVYSLFANYLVHGFTHADLDGDGSLTFQELYDFAAPRALLDNPGQTAQTYNGSVLSSTEALSFTIPYNAAVQDAIDQQELEPITAPGPFASWYRNTAITHDGSDAARSPIIGNSEASSFSCRVVGPGTLSFWWRVSSEESYDGLILSIDSIDVTGISGESGWLQETLEVGPGEHFITWSYTKDYIDIDDPGLDCGWVDEVAWTPQQGTPSPALAEAIDNALLPVFTGGSAGYVSQGGTTHDGSDAAKSDTLFDSESSWMMVDVIGPGELSFWWKVSSEYGYDMYSFSIDEEHKARISGEVSWQQATYSIGPGTHTLGWCYAKDLYATNGQDCAWLDQVTWTGDSDLDGDSLPTSWELTTGLDHTDPSGPNGAEGNPDGDRLSNLEEYICGSNPTNPASCTLAAEALNTENAAEHIIEWSALPGRRYSIYYGSTLTGGGYELLEEGMEFPRNSYTDTVSRASSSDFYRIDVELIH